MGVWFASFPLYNGLFSEGFNCKGCILGGEGRVIKGVVEGSVVSMGCLCTFNSKRERGEVGKLVYFYSVSSDGLMALNVAVP